jgi:hypothetical protein
MRDSSLFNPWSGSLRWALLLLTSCSLGNPRIDFDPGAEVRFEDKRYTLFMPWPEAQPIDAFGWDLFITPEIKDVLGWFEREPWGELAIHLVNRPEGHTGQLPDAFVWHRWGVPDEIYIFVPRDMTNVLTGISLIMIALRHELIHVLLHGLDPPIETAWIHEGLGTAVEFILTLGAPRAWTDLPGLKIDREDARKSLAVGVPELLPWQLGHDPPGSDASASYIAAMSFVDFMLRREGDRPFREALRHVADLDDQALLALEPEWERLRERRGF